MNNGNGNGNGNANGSSTKVYAEIESVFGQVPSWIKSVPDVALSPLWRTMRDFYLAETVIPNKYKELIGLAVSGATRCRYCALFHTEAAKLYGATDAEIAEASYMGAFTMLASTFINAEQVDYEQFRRETLEIIKFVKQHGQGKSARPGREAHV
jgi:AhpD family alkylhydroperoxidase